MNTLYENTFHDLQVKVDEVNVHVGRTHYPVRNISMVHVKKASRPEFNPARIALIFAVIVAITPLLNVMDGGKFFHFSTVLFWAVAYFLYLVAPRLIGVNHHTLVLGSSGSDRNVVVLYPANWKMLKPYIFKSLDWDEMSAASYEKISGLAVAITDSIDLFQNKKGSD